MEMKLKQNYAHNESTNILLQEMIGSNTTAKDFVRETLDDIRNVSICIKTLRVSSFSSCLSGYADFGTE